MNPVTQSQIGSCTWTAGSPSARSSTVSIVPLQQRICTVIRASSITSGSVGSISWNYKGSANLQNQFSRVPTSNASVWRTTWEDCPRAWQPVVVVMLLMTTRQRGRCISSVPVPRHVRHTGFFLTSIKVGVKVDLEVRLIHQVVLFCVFLVLFVV